MIRNSGVRRQNSLAAAQDMAGLAPQRRRTLSGGGMKQALDGS